MINLKDYTINIDGVSKPIVKSEVWFRTPLGLLRDRLHAIEVCEKLELDCEFNILSIPVFITEEGMYETR